MLHDIIQQRLLSGSSRDWVGRLTGAGVPAAPINELGQAIDDPMTAERRILVSPDGPADVGDLPLLRLPIDHRHEAPRRRPPKLGEHTEEVLLASGLSPEEVATLLRHQSSPQAAEV
jgi:formyl-CoA transferase